MSKSDKNRAYHFKRLSSENLGDLEKLHAAVYGKEPAAGFFLKKYDTAFTGIGHVGYIAYNDEGLPVAFYAVIPCFMQFDDKIVLSAQSADTMTHAEYRNKGLFVELAQLTFKLCESVGVRFVFGFPNQNSLPGFINKLGWELTERMDCFIIEGAAFQWSAVLNKFSILRKLYDSYCQIVLKKYLLSQTGIANTVFGDGFAGVYRDQYFLKYKTYTNTCVIKTGNSIVWMKINGMLLIGDMEVKPGDFEDTMLKITKLARKLGIKEIHFHASPGTTLHKLFAAHFKSIPSFPCIFKDFEGNTPVNKIKFTSADIDTF